MKHAAGNLKFQSKTKRVVSQSTMNRSKRSLRMFHLKNSYVYLIVLIALSLIISSTAPAAPATNDCDKALSIFWKGKYIWGIKGLDDKEIRLKYLLQIEKKLDLFAEVL